MASPSGTSPGSSLLLQNSGSDEDLQQLMDQRKRKRMISNRESARRSRMKKQQHLDDLTAQVAELRKETNQIISSINVTTQHYLTVEGENSILRAQVTELSHRLESLNEIISLTSASNGYLGTEEACTATDQSTDGFMNTPWNSVYLNQSIMASSDMLQF